jgi:transcriptional regulator with XRE-family HTH domain
MSTRLNEAQIAEVRGLAADGVKQREIAQRLGVSQSCVSRLVAGERRAAMVAPVAGRVADAVAELVNGSDLDAASRVRAETALLLAGKLDALAAAESVGSGTALPALARQMLELVDGFADQGEQESSEERIRRMLEPLRRL